MMNDSKELNIVVIGGGHGAAVVLKGLKRHTSKLIGIVTMFDSGGSSGLLQEEFGYPPLGDVRRCLLSLCDDSDVTGSLREMIEYRFHPDSSLNGHSLGNLLLAAFTSLENSVEQAIDKVARLLRISGSVIPVSLGRADLCAQLEDGRIVRGESNIDLRGEFLPRINRVFLDPPVSANTRAIEAILSADAVVLGPGDLYTSIVPNLLVDGVSKALAETEATKIYICNIMTKLGETDGFKASDFVREMLSYLGGPYLDWAMINTQPIPEAVLRTYQEVAAYPVEADLEAVRTEGLKVFASRLSSDQADAKHDIERTSKAILSLARSDRACPTTSTSNLVVTFTEA